MARNCQSLPSFRMAESPAKADNHAASFPNSETIVVLLIVVGVISVPTLSGLALVHALKILRRFFSDKGSLVRAGFERWLFGHCRDLS